MDQDADAEDRPRPPRPLRWKEAPSLILGAAVLFVVGVNVVNATGRYFFGMSFTGADELMVYTVVWIVMAGTVLSMAKRSHISLNLVPGYLPARWRTLLFAGHELIGLVACAYATHAAWLYTTRLARLGVTSMGLGMPMVIPHAALLLGFGALVLVCAWLLLRDLLAFIRNDGHIGMGAR